MTWTPPDSYISATDKEHDAALRKAREIREDLGKQGCPIYADSGNGGHLMYALSLPPDDSGLVPGCLTALFDTFSDEEVSIDETVFNPARIWKLYGTVACKGDHTEERPHRLSRISRPRRKSRKSKQSQTIHFRFLRSVL